MNKYRITCTQEQVRKAYSLGAPLMTFGYGDLGDTKDEILRMNGQVEVGHTENGGILVAQTPTAEQMVGWLEDKMGVKDFCVCNYFDLDEGHSTEGFEWSFDNGRYFQSQKEFPTRQEATLDAIDNILDRLTSKQE